MSLYKTIEEYLNLPYTIEITRDNDPDNPGWVACVVELPGCMTQGDTFAELGEMIEDAMYAWIEVSMADGDPIPEPRPIEDFSGKFVTRIPRSLHRDLVQTAEKEGVSLNAIVNFALARTTGRPTADRLPTPKRPFPPTTIAEVAGYLAYDGSPKTIEEMAAAVPAESAMMKYAIPKFPTADIQLALAFYEQKLGFARLFDYENYAAVERDNLEIHLWQCDDKRIAENTGCRVAVTDIEALYAEYQ